MRARGIFALAAALWLAAAAADGLRHWVADTELPPLSPATGAEVTDREGRLLRAWQVSDGRWRLAMPPGGADPLFTAALIAYEDRRFLEHSGVDLRAMTRATAQALWHGKVVSGGSTLTMQVARLLEESGTGRLAGKLRQIRVALALEQRLSKPEILDLYLRLAPYGGNIEGLRAASLIWFGREPGRLTPAQVALLVALPQSPESRRPDRHPAAAAAGRDRVLARLEGAGLLDAEAVAAARAEPLPRARRDFPRLAPHLTDRLRRESPAELKIATSLDAGLQARLEALATETVTRMGARMQIALVVADHRSGEILAQIGSAAYDNDGRQGFVDMTEAIRSPGSTLKPLVYGLAFDDGLAHPETLIEDQPVAFGRYAPQNFDRQFRGTIRLREALQLSLNIPVVVLTDALGPERLMQALGRAGVRTRLPGNRPAGLAVALGGIGVNLVDLTGLYAALARGGVARPLTTRLDGTRAAEVTEAAAGTGTAAAGAGTRLMSQVAAWQLGDILAGLTPPDGSPRGRIAWKTGTSYGYRDSWSLGWDGRHVVGVWLGRADGTPVPGALGGEVAAPVMFQAFGRISTDRVALPLPPPATLMVDTARLPPPLQRFRPRGAILAPGVLPEIAFPPDGAEVALEGAPLLARVRGGTAPFTWLVDGLPLAVGHAGREVLLPVGAGGRLRLSVIDANGRSHRVEVSLSP